VDSEGAVKVSTVKWKSLRWLSLNISITNSDLELLRYTKCLLKKCFGINSIIKGNQKMGSVFFSGGKRYVRNKDSYELVIGALSDVRRFSSDLGFSINKKQRKLHDAIRIFDESEKPSERFDRWLELYEKRNSKWVRKDL
jgi:intein-encoded DNA endonuclease-like protein